MQVGADGCGLHAGLQEMYVLPPGFAKRNMTISPGGPPPRLDSGGNRRPPKVPDQAPGALPPRLSRRPRRGPRG